MLITRRENPEDVSAVRQINLQAFGGPEEAALVDALREAARPFISLVAVAADRVVGHISFSPVMIEGRGPAPRAMGLAPMAVLPEYQRRGIGSQLVHAGLEECQRLGREVVVVVGHPRYYPRFGFIPAHGKGLRCEYEVPEEAFMVAELRPGALDGAGGIVRYHEAFSRV